MLRAITSSRISGSRIMLLVHRTAYVYCSWPNHRPNLTTERLNTSTGELEMELRKGPAFCNERGRMGREGGAEPWTGRHEQAGLKMASALTPSRAARARFRPGSATSAAVTLNYCATLQLPIVCSRQSHWVWLLGSQHFCAV